MGEDEQEENNQQLHPDIELESNFKVSVRSADEDDLYWKSHKNLRFQA